MANKRRRYQSGWTLNDSIRAFQQDIRDLGKEYLMTDSQKVEGQQLLDIFKWLDDCHGADAPAMAGYRKEDGSPDTVGFFNAKVKATRDLNN